MKFADDSVIVSILSSDNPDHGPVVRDFTDRCESFLQNNVSKTKEMVIDFRKKRTVTLPVVISGVNVEIVNQYKYLGTVLDDRLTFEVNVDSLCKKAHQRVFLSEALWLLWGFCFYENVLFLFYPVLNNF